jgi:hypothetical protein
MRVFPKCNARLNIIQNIVILSAESRERKVYKWYDYPKIKSLQFENVKLDTYFRGYDVLFLD